MNKNPQPHTHIEINTRAIAHNLRQLKKLIIQNYQFSLPTRPKPKNSPQLLTIIKADAYGHGMLEIAKVLCREGVTFLGVSDVQEGVALREHAFDQSILLLESILPDQIDTVIKYQLMPTICTLEVAKALNRKAKQSKKIIDIHIKVDTGMGRLGVWHTGAIDFIAAVNALSNIRIMGLMTHFPAADTDKVFTQKQLDILYDIVTTLDQSGLIIPYIHAANSMGLAGYKTHILNLARPGLMLYGLYPHASLRERITLKPVMTVKSRVIFYKDIEKGQSISYGRTFFTKRAMRIATIPIGYNDGYFRALSNKASVLIGGMRCPVLGTVTMDQIMVDVSAVKNVRLGMPVIIIGKQGNETISAYELALEAGTINYEIVCSLGNRLFRVFK